MNKREEKIFLQGNQAAWRQILYHCLPHLNDTLEKSYSQIVLERSEAIQSLRNICQDFGDLDWDNNLHLADIINKHLGKHLYDKE